MEEELDKNVGRDMTPQLIKDLGMRYPTEKSSRKYRYGLYECAYCGKEWETISNTINTKSTKSCGCQKINTLGITHGLKSNKYYQTWCDMINRCNNPKNKAYKDYGGRGITVCGEWLDVTIFIAWCESTHPNIEGLSIDRIDNDKGYSPDNCRWTDATTQNINQRIKKNNTSGFVGVDFKPNENKYVARITVLGNRVYIGYYSTKEEAVLARDNYITQNNLPHKLSTDYIKET